MSETDEQKLEALKILPADEITEDEIRDDPETGTYMFSDEAAVKLVVDDTELADNYINIQQWASGWTMADTLYQSPASTSAFDGGNVAQANVPKFTVSNHLSSIVPKLVQGIFYEDPPFLLRPRPGTKADVLRAKTALFAAQFEDMKFEEECERTLDQMGLFGTGIMKWGWAEYTKKEKVYKREAGKMQLDTPAGSRKIDTPDSDKIKVNYKDKTVSRPWIKYCDIRTVLVDPGCRYGDIRRASWVVYRDFATYQDLDRLRGFEGYDIPEEGVLKALFNSKPSTGVDNISMTIPEGMRGYLQHAIPRSYKNTADPMKAPIEVLERWDDERVIVVLHFNGHNVLIRNEANLYQKIPFLSANWRNIPDCFYGQGLGILIGAEQLVEQGVTNLALDLLAYGLQPTAVRKKGFNAPTQQIRWKQGGIIDVDEDVDKAFKFLQMPPVPGEAWQFIAQAQSAAATTSGANEQVVQGAGSPGVRTTGMRSGTGAAAVVQANASRLDGPDGRFIRQIFEPWLYIMDDLNNDLLPTSTLRDVLGEELGEIIEVDHVDFRNAKIEYEVLAGAHLGPKKEMTQFIPIMFQEFNNPTFVQACQDAGYMFDAPAIFKTACDMAGYKYSQEFLRKMTPQEAATHAANKPAAIAAQQAQAAQTQQLQKFQQEQTLEDQKQLGKAGAEVIRQTTEHALNNEEVEGQPGNTGFGDVTSL
jgi:hypothetical protein